MRPVGYGRPGTKVFPDGWAENAAHVFEGTLECQITIGPLTGGAPTWNPDTKQTESSAGTPIYDGAASISVITDTSRITIAAEDEVPVRRYAITLPADTAGIDPEGHVVKVTASPDAMLTGATFAIESITRGGRRFTRELVTTLND